jgi:hypothetical protein
MAQCCAGSSRRESPGPPAMVQRMASGNVNVWIYINGQPMEPGFQLSVNKKSFPHWITFLDVITQKSGVIK